MKSILYISLLYLCLSLLAIGCHERPPEPACRQAEVVGQDCESGWYVLRLLGNDAQTSHPGSYVGQIQAGYVTTDNLPAAYQQEGHRLSVALELNGAYSPRCVTTHMLYPAVRVKHVCSSN